MKRVISLFTGCGGLDKGIEGGFKVPLKCINTNINPDWIEFTDAKWATLKRNEFSTVLANDINVSCGIAYTRHFNHQDRIIPYLSDSIVDLVKRAKSGEGPLLNLSADLVTGGFPCQDFSLNGKRLGFNSKKNHYGKVDNSAPSVESRGMLYYWMMQAIDVIRPKCFIAENVKGLALMEDIKQLIKSDFESIGYIVMPARVLYAPQYGIAQTRERVIFLGFNRSQMNKEAVTVLEDGKHGSLNDPYPPVTHKFKAVRPEHKCVYQDPNLNDYVTLRDVFIDLEEPHLSNDRSHMAVSKAAFLIKKVQGQSEVDLDGPGPTIRSEHHGNIEYRRLASERGGRYTSELNMGKPERRLSVRECARIQSFPDDYEFVIPSSHHFKSVHMSEAYKMVGNAVPPLLGYHLARRLQHLWSWLFTA